MRAISLAVLLAVLGAVDTAYADLVGRQDSGAGGPSGQTSAPSTAASQSQSQSQSQSPSPGTNANVTATGTSTGPGSSSVPSTTASSANATTSAPITSTPTNASTSLPSASSTWVEPPPASPAHTGVTGPGVAYNFTGMNLTYYYDNFMPPHKACAAVSGGMLWSLPIVQNPSACGPSIWDLHTDNVVALNVSWLNQDNMAHRADLCGREVQIWRDGRLLPLPKLFLYEACAACATMPRADVSVGTYIAATGDALCERGTVGGFDVLVLDRKVKVRGGGGRVAADAAAVVAAGVAALALAVL